MSFKERFNYFSNLVLTLIQFLKYIYRKYNVNNNNNKVKQASKIQRSCEYKL